MAIYALKMERPCGFCYILIDYFLTPIVGDGAAYRGKVRSKCPTG